MGVMGAKLGTKHWGDTNKDAIVKRDNVNNISANDKEKLNNEDVGNVLNKIADPNWVDPSKQVRGVGSDKLDKDAFMKLMLAQMKNQDPTNPMKSHEMAAQLAQFTGVEQMMNMNQTLGEMQKAQKPAESFQALNFIGKAVAGDSAKLIRAKGDTTHDISFNLPDDAKDVEVKIRNEQGEVIRKVDLKDMKKGPNSWAWNGKTENGQAASTGEYSMFIEAKNAAGKKLTVKTDFEGIITGVNYTPEGPVLLVGTQSVKLKDVKKIVDPSLAKTAAAAKNATGPDLQKQQPASNNEEKGAEEAAPTPMANLEKTVGMAKGMMDKVGKETRLK